MKFRLKLLTPLVALSLAGCASAPTPPDTSDSHPANPRAAIGAASATPSLMAAPTAEPAPPTMKPTDGHTHDHGQHGAMPGMKEAK